MRSVHLIIVILILVILSCVWAFADGVHGELGSWFEQLASPGGGKCCEDHEGIPDVDWIDVRDPKHPEIAYQVAVPVDGGLKLVEVPTDRVVTEPNRFNRSMIWVIFRRVPGKQVELEVRCFMPGSRG